MRKSLLETKEIDRYLRREMDAGTRLLFHAKMVVSPMLKEKVAAQRMLHAAVVRLGREERKVRLETLYGELMQERGFRQMVGVIFGGADQ